MPSKDTKHATYVVMEPMLNAYFMERICVTPVITSSYLYFLGFKKKMKAFNGKEEKSLALSPLTRVEILHKLQSMTFKRYGKPNHEVKKNGRMDKTYNANGKEKRKKNR